MVHKDPPGRSQESYDPRLVYPAQRLLLHQIALALYTDRGDKRLTWLLADLGRALQTQALKGGVKHHPSISLKLDPRLALGEALSPLFEWKYLGSHERLLRYFGTTLLKENRLVRASRSDMVMRMPVPPVPGEEPEGDEAEIGEGGGTATTGNEETEEPTALPDSEDGATTVGEDPLRPVKYNLHVQLTRVKAWRLTTGPSFMDDDFRLTGGYVLSNGDNVSTPGSLPEWNYEFEEGEEATSGTMQQAVDFQLPKKLMDEPIPKGSWTFHITLVPTEEDPFSSEAAKLLGQFASFLMTLGVDLLVGMAIAAGHTIPGATQVTNETQQLIQDHAIPGIVGAIRRALGPELFDMPKLRVETEWDDDEEIRWRSWAWYSNKQTDPFQSTGPSLHTGADIRIDESTIEPDQHGVLQPKTVPGGGTYTLDVEIRVNEV